jgi:hypothetical protein
VLQIFFDCTLTNDFLEMLLVAGDPEGFLGALDNWFEGMTRIV